MKYLRKLSLITFVFASAFLLATPVIAAKKAEVSGAIEGIVVVDSNGFESFQGTSPSHGEKVRFLARVDGSLAPKSFVYITVVCTQDSKVVYQWSSSDLDFEFPLADQAGQGLEWPDGTGASCTGALIYREQKGRKITIEYLDQMEFTVLDTSS